MAFPENICYNACMNKFEQKLTISAEDYLEAALILTLNGERIKVTSVAERLGVSKPAVTNALSELAEKGLLIKQPYGDISLTEQGKKKAERIYGKHRLLHDFLLRLGVSEQTAGIDCCKIEHDLSDETVECIKKFMGI